MPKKTNLSFIKVVQSKPLAMLKYKKRPDIGFRKHPSNFFKRNCLKQMDGMTNEEIALRLGISSRLLSNFLNEKVDIKPYLAAKLAKATAVGLGTWLELQRQYDLYINNRIETENLKK